MPVPEGQITGSQIWVEPTELVEANPNKFIEELVEKIKENPEELINNLAEGEE